MTAEENRKRIARLRAEEAGPSGGAISAHPAKYGPERRRRAQLNKQRERLS